MENLVLQTIDLLEFAYRMSHIDLQILNTLSLNSSAKRFTIGYFKMKRREQIGIYFGPIMLSNQSNLVECNVRYIYTMIAHQKINHFPGMYSLARKNHLGRNLMKMRKVFPDDFKFFP